MKKSTTLLSTLLAFSFFSCQSSNTPEQAVLDFYKASQESNYPQALSCTNLTPEEQEQVIQIMAQTGMVIHSYEVIETHIDEGDSTASVSLRLVSSNAFNPDTTSNDLNIPCVKASGQWKVKII